jgi:hypothetical protein
MPLTQVERQRLNALLDGMTAGEVAGDSTGSGLDRLATSIDRFAAVIAPAIERVFAAGEEVISEGPATDTPRRRGRKPQAGGGDGVAATAHTPGATAPTAPPPSAAQSVAQGAHAHTHPPAQADLGGFAGDDNTDPFGEAAPAGNGKDPLEVPDNLRRAPSQPAPQAAPPSAQEVRDRIKKYMDKNGIPAANEMLMKVAGTKKFAEVTPDRYAAILTACAGV